MKEGKKISGPGEVISEIATGFRLQVLRGKMSAMQAQEKFSKAQRTINICALAFPNMPWETDSTQVRSLYEAEKVFRRRHGHRIKSKIPLSL